MKEGETDEVKVAIKILSMTTDEVDETLTYVSITTLDVCLQWIHVILDVLQWIHVILDVLQCSSHFMIEKHYSLRINIWHVDYLSHHFI